VLKRFQRFAPEITAERVHAAMLREALPLTGPLLRFEGRKPPQGSEEAIRAAWDEAMRAPLQPAAPSDTAEFGYTDFGPPGVIVSDVRERALGIRQLRFANGVRLNLKRTRFEKGRVMVEVSVDGGEMLGTRTLVATGDNPADHAAEKVTIGVDGTAAGDGLAWIVRHVCRF
jgi:zinc protease